jgi:hypothetical protein
MLELITKEVCNGDALYAQTSNLPDYCIDRCDKEQTSALVLLEARLGAEQASRNARRFVPFI